MTMTLEGAFQRAPPSLAASSAHGSTAVLLGARAMPEKQAVQAQLPHVGCSVSFKVAAAPPIPLPSSPTFKTLAAGAPMMTMHKAASVVIPPGVSQSLPAPASQGPALALSLPALQEAGIPNNDRRSMPKPPGADAWTRFETDLYVLSRGAYNPALMARRRRIPSSTTAIGGGTGSVLELCGRVSVVVPTMSSRQRYHEQMWANFQAQQWPDKELIVVETYEEEPSEFLQLKAKEDSRFVLVSFRVPPAGDYSVGLKRDMTLHLASGEYIVNFDDDDVYAPTYVPRMVQEMRERGLAGLTLSSWYNYFETSGMCGYTDPDSWPPEEDMDEVLFGYGFSYVHLRRVALALPYPDVEFAEDYPFFSRLREALGKHRVALKADTQGLCVHVVHPRNSAGAMPITRYLSMAEMGKLEVAPTFQLYLDTHSTALINMYRSLVERCNLAVESLAGILPGRREGKRLTHRRVKTC